MFRAMGIAQVLGAQLRRPSGPLAPLAATAMRRINRRPYRLAIEALGVEPQDRVLELGFGPGEGVRALSDRVTRGEIWGVDHSEAMLAEASRRNAEAIRRNQVKLCLGAFEQLPLPDASADRVLAVNVAYFWGESGAVLQEIGRVLRPGGRLAVYVTDASTMRGWRFAGPQTHAIFTADALKTHVGRPPFEPKGVRVDSVTLPFGVKALVATVDR